MLTQDQVKKIKHSFSLVEPIAPQAANLFYNKLFELDPNLKPLFSGNIEEQGLKLMQTIAIVVRSADKMETILPAVQDLARRHVNYGVTKDHYATVGQALLWTLEQGLGRDFTFDVREAWVTLYTQLSETMIKATESTGK